MDRMAPLPLLR